MKTSQQGIELIKKREGGFQSRPYRDANGYSIGYGHFIKTDERFTVISEAVATQLLESDLIVAENAVNDYIATPLTQNQFDALVSAIYNFGVGSWDSGSLIDLLNAEDFSGFAAKFKQYNKSQGVVNSTLIARRDSELKQFFTA